MKTAATFAVICACALQAFAQNALVAYPEYPAQIKRDNAYSVTVRQGKKKAKLPVYNHCEKSILADRTRGGDVNRRFCEFAFSGDPVTVEIAVTEDVQCYKVFPARRQLKHSFKDGVISVTLPKPCYFGIQLNDYDKTILSVLADEPENAADIPKKGTPGVLFVDGWLDAPGQDGMLPVPKELKEIYIAPGAVLNARVKTNNKGFKVHGRGMILDPMSDIFRYDQSLNKSRGLLTLFGAGSSVEGIKLVDARTFNFQSWTKDMTYRNVKAFASMMCSDGFTNGGKNLRVENAWLYVGDNALVVSGVDGALYRDVVIGTSCKAIFPQGTNKGAVLENIDVFRADEGIIANVYNGVLRRNNKWHEMNTGLQKREPGPQDLKHQEEEFFFDTLSSVDATYIGYVFRGKNMGDLPKTFAFRNLSVQGVPGAPRYKLAGKKDGVSVAVENDPKRYLITHNYALSITNLYLEGKLVSAFPDYAVKAKDETELKLSVVKDPSIPRTVPLGPDRVVVNWKCPKNRKLPLPPCPENLLEDNKDTQSVWQRAASWKVKFDACRRGENGEVLYRLFQCEKFAGMQSVITERIKASGYGKYKLTFDAKAKSEEPFGFRISSYSNDDKKHVIVKDVDRSGEWKTYEAVMDFGFDPKTTDLAALFIAVTSPADEVFLRNLKLVKMSK